MQKLIKLMKKMEKLKNNDRKKTQKKQDLCCEVSCGSALWVITVPSAAIHASCVSWTTLTYYWVAEKLAHESAMNSVQSWSQFNKQCMQCLLIMLPQSLHNKTSTKCGNANTQFSCHCNCRLYIISLKTVFQYLKKLWQTFNKIDKN